MRENPGPQPRLEFSIKNRKKAIIFENFTKKRQK